MISKRQIYKRGKNKTFWIDVTIRDKRIRQSLDTRFRDVAEKKAEEIIKDVLEKEPETRQFEKTMTLGLLIDMYVSSKMNAKVSTKEFFRYMKKSLIEYFSEDMEAVDMNIRKADEYRLWCVKKGNTVDTLHHKVGFLKSVYKFAYDSGYIHTHKLGTLRIPKQLRNREVKFLTDGQVKKLLSILDGHNRDAALVAVNTGMRKNEVLNLQ